MRLIESKCPNCGASIQVEEDRKICFCSYCGTRCMVDDGTIHIIDEAKIREAEALEKVKLAEMEGKTNNKQIAIIIGSVVLLYILAMIMMFICMKYFI